MLPTNPELDSIRACYGKSWRYDNPVCTGAASRGRSACSVENSCKLAIAHKLLASSDLNRANRPPAPPPQPQPQPLAAAWDQGPRPITPPVAARPAPQPPQPAPQHYPQPPTYPYHPHYPHYPPPPPPGYEGHPYYQQHHGAQGMPPLPVRTEGVQMAPHTTFTAPMLSRTEPRKRGKKLRSFLAEMGRAAAKGMFAQGAFFVDGVPIFDDEEDE